MMNDNAIALIHAASAARRIGLSVRIQKGFGQLVRVERAALGGCNEYVCSEWMNGSDLLRDILKRKA